MCDDETKKENLIINQIIIGDFQVASNTSSLKQVEQTINRLIEKHKDFADIRRYKKTFESGGFFEH